MPEAATTPTTSRRSALRGFGLTAIAAGLAVPVRSHAATAPDTDDADAELIRLCAEFDGLEHARQTIAVRIEADAALANGEDGDREIALYAQQEQIAALLFATPAHTLEGIQAKARSWVLWAPEVLEGEGGLWDDKWRTMIIRDLLAGDVT
jgi:hypothetical protein